MSMRGAWPDEEEVALSIETESSAYEEDEKWLNRIDVWGLHPYNYALDFASKDTYAGRPLVEPPMFNYDDFERRFVPSRKRFQILFPERRDVGKMTDYMDRHIEMELLRTYRNWVDDLVYREFLYTDEENFIHTWGEQGAFYSALREDLLEDEGAVGDEMHNSRARGSGALERWEFEHLDNDLGTTHIERELARHRDGIFEFLFPGSVKPPEIRSKYQHLFPADADDDFRHWHQRTKRALKKEVEESSKIGKEILYREVYVDGEIHFYVLQPAAHHKARTFGSGYFAPNDKTYDELIRVYKNGRVLYPEHDSERGKDWLEYIPPKIDDERF